MDITLERVALQLLFEEIQGNDFQKNEQAQKKGERLAMRGHGTGVVKWLGIFYKEQVDGVSKRGI